ncbi:ankyrin repeat domain-containing protein [Limnohabitans sp.]|uniref:ankyrin repeat domain-containing protein n=1 Tax=Limnohabitans sp. TaxID=1907725 RepID=UPI00286EF16A|nr:ankyrin repeat domain-containing protein [Limnohabitans sp.]
MRKYFKYFLYLYVFIGYSLSIAGSYDDFISALHFDRPEVIQKLLARGFDPNTPNEKGIPGLLVAIQSEAPKAALVLAQHPQTQINVHNQSGETPLMLAAINNQLELAKVLIDRGADVNREGWTPLHYAATRGHREMMRLLLEHDAYIDSASANGTTPLMLAAYAAPPLAVKLLLEEGADPTLANNGQATALSLALTADHQQSAFYIRTFIESWYIQNPLKE